MTMFSLPIEFDKPIRALSRETGRSTDDLLREAMANYLEDMEDREDAEEARKVLAEYRCNPGKPFSLDDALDRYGLKRVDLAT